MIPTRPTTSRRPGSSFEFRASNSLNSRGSIILKTLFILLLAAAVFGGGAYYAYTLFILPDQNLKRETALGALTPPPDTTIPEYQRIHLLLEDHHWVDARTAYEHFIESYPASTRLEAAKDDLGEVNIAIYFSSGPSPDKDSYLLKPGDTLARIEKRLKVPGDVIMRSNGITDPRRLPVGDTLYIPHPDFSLIVDRSAEIVTLYNHARFFKQYHPTRWAAPTAKGSPPPIAAKVNDVAAFRNGLRVAFGSDDYQDSSHWIQISPGGYSLFTDPAQGGEKTGPGIALGSSDMDELSALLTRGVPVTIR